MTIQIEKKNQDLVTEYLQKGYELVTSKVTGEGLVYVLSNGDEANIDVIVIKSGEVSFQKEWNAEKIEKLVSTFKTALSK